MITNNLSVCIKHGSKDALFYVKSVCVVIFTFARQKTIPYCAVGHNLDLVCSGVWDVG